MTAVEWLNEKLFNEFGFACSDNIFEQAKEIEKQQIMNAYIIADSESTIEDSEHNALNFYERTYVSKGSDEYKYHEQVRGINVDSFQSEAPQKQDYIIKVLDVTGSHDKENTFLNKGSDETKQ